MLKLALTDDEVVALAGLASTSWPSPLPTVDATNAPALAAAAARGIRSATIRELVRQPAPDIPLEMTEDLRRLVGPLLEHRVALSSFITTDGWSFVAKGTTLFHYVGGDDSWRTEVISPAGVHYISRASRDDCRAIAQTMLEQTYANGITAPDDESVDPVSMYLCTAGPAEEATLLLTRRGELLAKRLDRAAGTLVDLASPATPQAAFAMLGMGG
jgi:hypothetical protein